jgi:predicted Rossmann-fold nucleotide-binding protein
MQAANEGAISAGPGAPGRSVGVRVELPFEQEVNPFVGEVYEHKTFFSRLHHFMIASDAFVVVPGGIGTLLELSMVWQLFQVRKLHVGKMWGELADWARAYMLRPGLALANAEDIAIPQCVGSVEETVAIIRANREQWLKQQAARAEASGQ